MDLTGAAYARGFSLPDQNGKTRTLEDFKGKVVVVFFGFTQCPDVCPTTLAELAQVKKALGPEGDKVQGVFITVDPERDKPELLKAYLESFDPGFVALRGSPEQPQGNGQGVQDLLRQGAWEDTGQLHDGPHGGELPVRSARAGCGCSRAMGRGRRR